MGGHVIQDFDYRFQKAAGFDYPCRLFPGSPILNGAPCPTAPELVRMIKTLHFSPLNPNISEPVTEEPILLSQLPHFLEPGQKSVISDQ
jgi:hypothetical protein